MYSSTNCSQLDGYLCSSTCHWHFLPGGDPWRLGPPLVCRLGQVFWLKQPFVVTCLQICSVAALSKLQPADFNSGTTSSGGHSARLFNYPKLHDFIFLHRAVSLVARLRGLGDVWASLTIINNSCICDIFHLNMHIYITYWLKLVAAFHLKL